MATVPEARTIQNRAHRAKQTTERAAKQLKAVQNNLQKAITRYNKEQARFAKVTKEMELLGITMCQGSFEIDKCGHVLPRKKTHPK